MKSITLFPSSPLIFPTAKQQTIPKIREKIQPEADIFVSQKSKEDLRFGGRDYSQKLFQAIEEEDENRVKKLLAKKGTDIVNKQDPTGATPFLKATAKNNIPIMRELLRKGADINQADMHGNTPLMKAVRNSHFEGAGFLVNLPNINITHKNQAGETAFGVSQSEQLKEMESLLAQKAQRVLLEEIQSNRKNKIEDLLSNGACLQVCDANGHTPLMRATIIGNIEVVHHLLNLGADPLSIKGDQTALSLAEVHEKEKIKDLFIKHIRQNHSLEDIISQKRLDILKVIPIAKDINELLPSGKTMLHHAVVCNYPEIIKYLLDQNADPDKPDHTGDTPLLLAGKSGDKQIVELLFDAGADPNASDRNGNTLLMYATLNNDLEMIKLALLRGAKIEQRNSKKQMALDLAEKKEIKKELKDALAGKYDLFQAVKSDDLFIVEQLIRNKININQVDEYGDTPLIYALRHKNNEVANLLLSNGADPRIKGKSFTPLHWSISKGLPAETVKLLLKTGADIEEKTKSGFTPLMLATMEKNPELIKCLLDAGAKLSPVDNNGDSVFEHAKRNKQDIFLNQEIARRS